MKHDSSKKLNNKENNSIYILTVSRKRELLDFCKRVNINFHDISLLDQAFHHKSIINEIPTLKNNERLEFLGDSVLGMATAQYLYRSLERPEGDLAKIKSAVVSEKALAPIALRFGLDKLLILGRGEDLSGGRNKPAILADCMEAIIGAYYLDAGYKNAEKYVLSFIIPEIEQVFLGAMEDYKTVLQEKYQKATHLKPHYVTVDKIGPDHDRTFKVIVYLGNQSFGPASAKSKKEAEQLAAKIALENYKFN